MQLAPAFIVVASWQWWQLICAPLIYGCIFHKVGKCELSSSRFLIFLRCNASYVAQHNSFAGSQATQYAGARELCPPFVNHLDVSLIGRPLASTKRTGTGKRRVCKGKPLTCPLPFGDYIAGSRTNDARWSKSGRQIECLVWWSEIFL